MKTIIHLLIAVVTAVLFFGCKKGHIAPGNNVAGSTFSETKVSGYSPEYKKMPDSGPGNTFLGTTAASNDDSDEEDEEEEEEEEEETTPDNFKFKGGDYNSMNVNCSSTASYYGISASVSSASVVCTLYFPSKPTASGSYSLEDISGSTPPAGKAWLVVVSGGTNYIAPSGTVYVTLSGSSITAVFSDISTSNGTETQSASGTLTCQ